MASGHDEGCLLALDQANMSLGIFGQQVLTERALAEDETIGQLATHSPMQQVIVNPSVVTKAMAVVVVSHDVPRAYSLLFVDLPEDDVSLIGTADMIVLVDTPYRFGIEVKRSGTIACKP